MKKTGRVLTAALAAMMCILPLAACDDEEGSASGSAPEVNGKAFSLADYALDLPDEMSLESKGSVHAEYSTVEEKSFEIETFSGFSDLSIAKEVGTGENSGKYRLYNLEQDTEALPDWYDSINLLSSSPFVSLKKEQAYQIAYPMGTLVTTQTFDSTSGISAQSFNWDNNTYGYILTYPDANGKDVSVYICNKGGTWAAITEEEYNSNSPKSYEVGDNLGIVKNLIVDKADYPDYIYSDYSYTEEGSDSTNYTFYHGDSKVGSVTVMYNSYSWFVGKYFYYYVTEPVSIDATKGYNVETPSGGSGAKANMTLHRYNFVEGNDETVESNYIFACEDETLGIYNKTTNDFDKVFVTAFRKTNGVAIVSKYSLGFPVLLDDEANISLNLSGKDFSGLPYALSSERFLSRDSDKYTIYDKDLNVVAHIPTTYEPFVWESKSMILFRPWSYTGYNREYHVIDYDGKIVMTGLWFTDGAYAYGDKLFATLGYGIPVVFSKDNPTGKPVTEIVTAAEGEQIVTSFPGLIVKVTTSSNSYTLYNLSGKSIGTAEGLSSYPSNSFTYGGKYYISATKNGSSVTYVVS